MSKGGRPSYETVFSEKHWNLLDILCGLPTQIFTQEEIVGAMRSMPKCEKLCLDTIVRLVKDKFDVSFSEYREQKRGSFRGKILQKQFEVAMKGNVGMLIWLGKNYCGQAEEPEKPKDDKPTDVTYAAEWGQTQEPSDSHAEIHS